MSTTTEVVKGELYPTQDVNPLEATFCLLKSMRHEIEELREMLDEERRARGGETANLAAQVQELRGAKQQRFKEVDDTIEDIKTDTLTRFQKLQERMDQTASVKEERFEILEAKMESESSDRTAMCQAVSKRLTHEASQLRERAETVDKEVQDQKRQFKIHGCSFLLLLVIGEAQTTGSAMKTSVWRLTGFRRSCVTTHWQKTPSGTSQQNKCCQHSALRRDHLSLSTKCQVRDLGRLHLISKCHFRDLRQLHLTSKHQFRKLFHQSIRNCGYILVRSSLHLQHQVPAA